MERDDVVARDASMRAMRGPLVGSPYTAHAPAPVPVTMTPDEARQEWNQNSAKDPARHPDPRIRELHAAHQQEHRDHPRHTVPVQAPAGSTSATSGPPPLGGPPVGTPVDKYGNPIGPDAIRDHEGGRLTSPPTQNPQGPQPSPLTPAANATQAPLATTPPTQVPAPTPPKKST